MNDDLLVKYLAGDADEKERLRVKNWVQADKSNEQHYAQLRLIWEESEKLASKSQANEDKAWERFRERIEKASGDPEQTGAGADNVRRIGPSWRWLRIAASAALIITAGWLVRSLVLSRSMVKLASGQSVLAETLPDGSVVTLNRDSRLSYPSGFAGENRSVTLQGEAFFKVAPDKNKPFIIKVNDVTVRVTGTSFNIKSRNDITEVIVETGVVRVSKQLQEVELKAGEKTTASGETTSLVKESTRNELYKYYRTREFVCDGTPLSELVSVLNEAYNSRIEIPDKELRQLRITTTIFKNDSLDKTLTLLSETFDIEVHYEENRIILKR